MNDEVCGSFCGCTQHAVIWTGKAERGPDRKRRDCGFNEWAAHDLLRRECCSARRLYCCRGPPGGGRVEVSIDAGYPCAGAAGAARIHQWAYARSEDIV